MENPPHTQLAKRGKRFEDRTVCVKKTSPTGGYANAALRADCERMKRNSFADTIGTLLAKPALFAVFHW